MIKPLHLVAGIAALVACLPATSFATSFYTSEAAFDAALGATPLTIQSFEGTPSPATATSLTFGDVTFSCVGTTYCPGFFGQSTIYATAGTTSVYGATPDAMVFTFATPITAFAIDTIGLADVGATSFSMALSDGSSNVMFTNISQPAGTVNFVSAIDSTGFTSVTFTGTQPNDGVFYDRLQYTATASVPEPGIGLLMAAGIAVLSVVGRRRKA